MNEGGQQRLGWQWPLIWAIQVMVEEVAAMGDVAGNVRHWRAVVWLECRAHNMEAGEARVGKVTWSWVPGSVTAGVWVGSVEDMGRHQSVLRERVGAGRYPPPSIDVWQQVPGGRRPAGARTVPRYGGPYGGKGKDQPP